MSVVQWITFWTLLLSFSQWILYAKFREWQRNREPEPKQSTAVNRVLWHTITNTETPWDAGTSWEKHGRGYIVALQRQGLDELLDERDVSDHKAAYTLGYTVREEADRREIDRLQKQLHRRDETIKRQGERIDDLREQLKRKPEPAPVHVTERPKDPLQAAWEEWGTCDKGIDDIMRAKGWVRIEPEPVHVAEEVTEDSTQTEEQTTDYKALKGKEKIETMLKLKTEGKTNAQIAQLFGMTTGGVKSIISKNKPKPDNIVTLDFGVSEEVSTGF